MDSFNFNCPHCGELLEATDEMIGSTVACPSCTGEISLAAPVEEDKQHPRRTQSPTRKKTIRTRKKTVRRLPSGATTATRRTPSTTGSQRKQQPEAPPPKKRGAITAGFICFFVGVLLMLLSIPLKINNPAFGVLIGLSSLIFFVAFILSIVAIAKKRIGLGILLLLLTLIVPILSGVIVATKAAKELPSLMEQAFQQGQAQMSMPAVSAELSEVIESRAQYMGQHITSRAKIADFGERETGFVVLVTAPENLNSALLMTARDEEAMSRARRICDTVGKGGTVSITYVITDQDDEQGATLLKIRIPFADGS